MFNITEFNIMVNKKKVFEIIDCNKDSHVYAEAERIYDEMLQKAHELSKPRAIFIINRNESKYNYNGIDKYSHVISCLVTIGDEISLEVSKNFKNNYYLEGLILDTIADQIMYNITDQLYEKIYEQAKKLGLGLTPRMSPGDKDIPMEVQKEILLNILERENIEVSITDGYMLKPVKSTAYFYGADENISLLRSDHDCATCNQINCKYKNKEHVGVEILTGDGKKSIIGSTQKSLLKNLVENGIDIESSCNGNGTCGKCKIQIIEGNIKPTEEEMSKLSDEELKNNIRLACYTYPKEDLVIKICSIDYEEFRILSNYQSRNIINKPIIEVKTIDAVKGDLEDQKSLTNKINDILSTNLHYSIKSLKKIGALVNKDYVYNKRFSLYGEDKLKLIIYNNEVMDVCNVTQTLVLGLAIDIGTTTIAISLIDLIKGKPIGSYTILNSQRQYGADVISRIQFSINDDSNMLAQCIKSDILKGIKKICNLYKVNFGNIYNIAIAGNTTMIYLLLELPAQSLAESPFTTTTTSLLEVTFNEVFNDDFIECKVILLPSISAYVGADIVAGMLNCGFDSLNGITMLIDIGTNGEMAIGNNDKIYCASTAAGPAFEGANIKDGIGSVKGAIYSVNIQDGNILYKTLGDEEPIGICGTGVIDIVNSGLKNGIIDRTGKLSEKYKERFIELYQKENKKICFYQKDIRELQLAKSALRSGIEILIKKFGCSYEDIEVVYIAGGFGNNLNIDSAKGIGLIPKELHDKIRLAGNSSLGGTVDFILNKNSKESINTIINKTTYIELSAEKKFNDLFIENMGFDNLK